VTEAQRLLLLLLLLLLLQGGKTIKGIIAASGAADIVINNSGSIQVCCTNCKPADHKHPYAWITFIMVMLAATAVLQQLYCAHSNRPPAHLMSPHGVLHSACCFHCDDTAYPLYTSTHVLIHIPHLFMLTLHPPHTWTCTSPNWLDWPDSYHIRNLAADCGTHRGRAERRA
jgi:hypothetical protein